MTDLERRLARPAAPTLDRARVSAELARRADAQGLLDVAWATPETPLGPIAPTVEVIKQLDIAEADRRKIFCGNAERLLNTKFS